jgi:hypothetical protein
MRAVWVCLVCSLLLGCNRGLLIEMSITQRAHCAIVYYRGRAATPLTSAVPFEQCMELMKTIIQEWERER